MKLRIILGAGALALVGAANAQVMFTGGTYSENFDGLLSTGSTNLSATIGTISPLAGTAWEGAKIGGTGTAVMQLLAGNGSGSSGALYSFGTGTDADRALGSVASGTNTPGFGVRIVNNTGVKLTQFTVSFTQENWRSSTTATNTIAFGYAFGGGSITDADYLTAAGFIANAALDLVGPAPVQSNGALDGNLAANQAARSATILLASDWNPGQTLYLRWQDLNDGGNDAGLGIDNLTFEAVPEPMTMGVLALAALAARRRKNKKS
ncbi:MAG: PEP-CTERM sorting domain-containing protein [Fimbriimonadaceae bacterium]|jgi:hypothetical protein|nr:PEP-CTERM sorting domain-containing protein [Fimbriimonadaceae bacterium]